MAGVLAVWVVKNAGPVLRNIASTLSAAPGASTRALTDEQSRKLARRFDVVLKVIDALMEREIETRESPTHGIRLEVIQPAYAP